MKVTEARMSVSACGVEPAAAVVADPAAGCVSVSLTLGGVEVTAVIPADDAARLASHLHDAACAAAGPDVTDGTQYAQGEGQPR